MNGNLNINPHTIYAREYESFVSEKLMGQFVGKTFDGNYPTDVMEAVDGLLDEMWNAQRNELFLACLEAQLENPDIKLSEAMELIFSGKHSKLTFARPVLPNRDAPDTSSQIPSPASARKWLGGNE